MRIQLFLGYPGKVQEQDGQGGIRHNFVILHIFAPSMLETHHGEFIGANTWIYWSRCTLYKQGHPQGFGMSEEQGQELRVRLDIRRRSHLSPASFGPRSWLKSCFRGVHQKSLSVPGCNSKVLTKGKISILQWQLQKTNNPNPFSLAHLLINVMKIRVNLLYP